MRFTDDTIIYAAPRKRVQFDYGYAVDEAELARVEDAARMMTNQALDDADYIRNVSRRSDNIAIEKANRMIEQSLNATAPPAQARPSRYPEVVVPPPRRSHVNRMTRSASVSEVSRVEPPFIVRPLYVARRPIAPTPRHIPMTSVPPSGVRRVHVPTKAKMAAPPSDYRRRLERKLDSELLDYEVPSKSDALQGIREHLRGLNDKMLAHRLLLDRYSGIDMAHPQRVEDNIESKCSELMARMPTLNRNRD